jgi:predicted  nucleic acid-binding Zn-ribbon protein
MGQIVTDEAYNELEIENDQLKQQVAKLEAALESVLANIDIEDTYTEEFQQELKELCPNSFKER